LISVDRDRIEIDPRSEIRLRSTRDRPEIDPRSDIRLRSCRDRPEIDDQIWSNSSSKLLVGRRNFFDPTLRPYNCYVTDPPRTTGVSIRLRSTEKPYPQRFIMHAEPATAPYGVIVSIWRFGRLRRPTRRPLYTKLRLRAFVGCVPVHPNEMPTPSHSSNP
jgi:hypothetical protein